MEKITLYNEASITATYVPNIFIDEHMTQANGEYVKIYLYLLRSVSQPENGFSLSQIADHFDCTERDILRALKYWEKLRLFRLEYDDSKNLSGICFLTDSCQDGLSASDEKAVGTERHFFGTLTAGRHDPSPDELRDFREREDVRELIFIAEKYLGRTLNQTDLSTIFFWYDDLHFSAELIEFLIENSVAKGHTNLRYMEKVAESYAADEIRTVEEARLLANRSSRVCHCVMKAFGIRGRNLIPSEINHIENWSGKWKFSEEMIAEACTRTIKSIHEPSFGYANSILEKWHAQGVRTMKDVQKADAAHQKTQHGKRAKKAQDAAPNRFHNFQQRENNNYDEIEHLLIKKSFQ